MQRPDADDLGRDVHIAHGHPHASHPAAHQVLGAQREHDRHRQHEDVDLGGGVDRNPE
jgi:hypothetical protein